MSDDKQKELFQRLRKPHDGNGPISLDVFGGDIVPVKRTHAEQKQFDASLAQDKARVKAAKK